MFKNISYNFNKIINNLKGQGRITEQNVEATLNDIKLALIEADAAIPAINAFLESVKKEIIGKKITSNLNPGQELIKTIYSSLTKILGEQPSSINLKHPSPMVILLVGLQGSGKTTTTVKLANRLTSKDKKRVLVSTADIYRPAAIEQLKVLSEQTKISYYLPETGDSPQIIATKALEKAKKTLADILIFDTAGRLHIDNNMMKEIKDIHNILSPKETLFVIDSMTGQDALNSTNIFHQTLPITGIILTKTDGDARGGVALSSSIVTGKPIKLIGTGEKIEDFEPFHPERVASRILNMGDMLSLIEKLENQADRGTPIDIAKKLYDEKNFNFNDLKNQLEQINALGGIKHLASYIPGLSANTKLPTNTETEKTMKKTIAIINSMTKVERVTPSILDASRKIRIAKGSGTDVMEINRLIKQLSMMQKTMKKYKKYLKPLPKTSR